MIVTRVYEFDGTRWVAYAEAFIGECGHVHWRTLRPRPYPRELFELTERFMWRGDDLAARGIDTLR